MTRPTNIVLDPDLRATAKRRAAERGLSMSAYIRDLIRDDDARTRAPAADITPIIGILGGGGGPTDMSRDKHRLVAEAFAAQHEQRLDTHGTQ
ncbi:hypothetical protein [Candidatus Poriferisodalis sp.]|uniref:hypothetical protein n=1 Tax=Candidatus Poriferisodalis sp. TaxID=3101277 RepID=UPI003B5CB5EC